MFTRQRQIDWSATMHRMGVQRAPVVPGARIAVAKARAFADLAAKRAASLDRPLVVAGRFDRSAIMRAAIAAAQLRRSATGDAWAVCLSDALRGVWATAKAYRARQAH